MSRVLVPKKITTLFVGRQARHDSASSKKSGSLRQRVFSAGALALFGHGLSLVIRFGSNLLLTRLLAPEMFGVMAIGMTVIIGLSMFSDVGLGQNIIRSPRGEDRTFLDTAWSMQVVRGLFLWVIAFSVGVATWFIGRSGMLSPTSVYSDPQLPFVIMALSLMAISGGLTSTKFATAGRTLSLGWVVVTELLSQVIGLLGVLIWVLFDRSVWALVAGGILSSVARSTLSHVLLPGQMNRWHWDKDAAAELFDFGKWVFVSSILTFVLGNGDRLLLGGMVNASLLGIYSIAVTIYSLLEQIMTRVMASAVFPALSELARDRPADLKFGFYRFHTIIAGASYFISGVIMIAGAELIYILYDHRYADAGWMLQVLGVGLLATPLQISIQCFMARGLPHIQSRVLVLRLLGLVVAVPLGFMLFGLPGALWGIVASQFFGVPIIAIYNMRDGLADLKMELRAVPFLLLGALAGEALKWTIRYLIIKS